MPRPSSRSSKPAICHHGSRSRQVSTFANDRRLSMHNSIASQLLKADCPEGDRSQTPPLPQFPNGWSLGEPDLVLKMSQPFEVPADGPDLYRTFVFEANLPEDRWIKAMELRPTARGAVHHALFFCRCRS